MLIVTLICFLYAFNVGWRSIEYAQASTSALRWAAPEGHVTISRGRRNTQMYYVYSVSGRTYSGNIFELPQANPLNWSASRWSNGQRVLVYFDPVAPQNSTVNRQLDERQYNTNLACAAIAVLLGVSAFASFLDHMTSHKARLGFR
jgi:hypothetical protein